MAGLRRAAVFVSPSRAREHAEDRSLGLIEDREQMLYGFLRIGWIKAKVDHASGHRHAGSIEESSVIPVECQKYAVFASRP